MPTEAVTFDADQTLLDFRTGMRAALAASVRAIQAIAPPGVVVSVDALIATRNAVAAEAAPTTSMETIRLQAFTQTLDDLKADRARAQELTDSYLADRFRLTRPYDDVIPALAALKTRCQIGLASNGNSYPDRSGLAGHFDFVVLAQEHGVRKPDPRFFLRVAEIAGTHPSNIVHVGDSLVEDVGAAAAAGFRTVWLNRDNDPPSTIRPWREIRSLTELPALLMEPENRAAPRRSL